MHAKTPAVSVKDSRGLGIASVSYFRNNPMAKPEGRIHRQRYDVAGRPTLSYDPRLFKLLETEPDARPNLRTVFSLTGAALVTDGVDAGTRLALFGVAGQHVIGWDSLHTQVQTEYDALLRPVRTIEQAQGSLARNNAFYTYGDNTPVSASRNQCSRLIRHDDEAGTVLFESYALTSGVISQTRHFLQDLNEPDWPADEANRDLLNETGNGATSRVTYNAVGTAILQEDAQNNAQYSDLDIAGQLRQVRLKLAGQTHETSLLNDIRYNANGNIERQTAGNGVVSEALYDPRDGRLTSVKAGLPDQPPLQYLAYGYDRVGNILSIRDATLGTRFFRNQKIEPVQSYVYDSLYQLIEVNGWQRVGNQNGPQEPVFVSPADPGQLENYRQVYSYDEGGNLTLLVHTAASHSWTQRTAISKYSNRGLAQKADGSLPGEDEIGAGFDANGNKRQLLAGQDLTWSPSNRLRQVDQVVRENAANDSEVYVYDGAGQRKRKVRLTYSATYTRAHEVRYLPSLEIRTTPEEKVQVIVAQAGRCAVQVLHWESQSTRADQYRYNLTNHLGSSTLELDGQANLISEEMYYPYGGTSWWAGPDKVQASYKTRRYCGQERDATGLYYYGQRYYAPWLERWISADPAGTADGLNLFAMVRGNPVRFVDFQGLLGFDTLTATAGMTVAREFSSALLASFLQYGVTAGATALLGPAQMVVTVLGATSGGITGGLQGWGAMRAANSADEASGWAPIIKQVGGAALGAALGAAPSLAGAFMPGNPAAAGQIGGLFGSMLREVTFQNFGQYGPSNPFPGRMDVATASASTLATSIAGGSAAAAGAVGFGSDEIGKLLQSTFANSIGMGVGLGGTSTVRGLRGAPIKPPGTGEINQSAAVIGSTSRHFFGSLAQAANMAIAQIPGYSELGPVVQTTVRRAVTQAVLDQRLTFLTVARPGLTDLLSPTNPTAPSRDIEMGDAGTESFEMADISRPSDFFYYESELQVGHRGVYRSRLNMPGTHM
ncbi:RHS repeat-associated core domain-containing protein [Pseudomonas fluorescens]|uniref:RHS repeat-associated core domain-containing protein n=1 Tax=Pseudomonas fluorescens TaxID=294 RepID=UPI0009BF82C0|nr:RHS repeat-associated core domain-containing protein [Pseudomonas fluorescens]